jgi:hypothetical protein
VTQSQYFKDRYASEWSRSSRRERIAEEFIRLLLPGDLVATGNGVECDAYTPEEGSMPDFYHPALGIWFEVTGSDLTREQSMQRCTAKFHRVEPCLFIREGKVEAARLNRVASKLCFISVNEMDGSILFLPCAKVVKYPLVEGYEKGGERYYMVPWAHWMRPYRFVSSLRWEL